MTKLTDAELASLARKYKVKKAKADAAKEAADDLKAKIMKELNRRGTKGITHGGVSITKVQRTHIEYDFEQLAQRLTPKMLSRIQVRKVDKDALGSLVQRGKIPSEDVDACATLHADAAYPLVTFTKDK